MTLQDALGRLLGAYSRYYTVGAEAPAPFDAFAEFHMSEDQVFLTRNVHLAESESSEYVYFALCDELTPELLRHLDEAAWRDGVSRVTPAWGQKGSDVTLIILTRRLASEAGALIPKTRHSRSAAFALKGWSNYRLIAMELPAGRLAANRLGRPLEETLRNSIFKRG